MPIIVGTPSTAFATPADLAVYLRAGAFSEADEASAALALEIATATVVARVGQTFALVIDDTVTLETFGDTVVRLPQRPVRSVSSVTTRDRGASATTSRTLHTDYEVTGSKLTWVGLGGYWPHEVTVVYTHGYDVIPADVKGATLAVAAELFDNPEGLSRSALDDETSQHEWSDDSPAERALKQITRRYGYTPLTVRLR